MNNKAIAYTLFALYIAASYCNPVWLAIFTVAFFISLPFFTEVVNTLFPIDGDYLYKSPSPSMKDYADAFAPIDEEEIAQEDTDRPVDIWEKSTNTCAFACPITSQYNYNYQLCLPAGNDIDISIEELTEQVIVISYESYSYRELQQLVKAIRGNDKSIKLTAKKAKLIEYLEANS